MCEPDLAELLNTLDHMLSSGDPEAKAMIQRVALALESDQAESLIALLTNQIENYDFDRARETLADLSRELGEELREHQDG